MKNATSLINIQHKTEKYKDNIRHQRVSSLGFFIMVMMTMIMNNFCGRYFEFNLPIVDDMLC